MSYTTLMTYKQIMKESKLRELAFSYAKDFSEYGFQEKSYQNLAQGIHLILGGKNYEFMTTDQWETVKRDADRKLFEETMEDEAKKINYLSEEENETDQ